MRVARVFVTLSLLLVAVSLSAASQSNNDKDDQMMGLDLLFPAPEGNDDPQNTTPFFRISFLDANCYLIKGMKQETGEVILMLFDAGFPSWLWQYQKIEKAIEQVGLELADLKYIFISHAHLDHYGSAKKLRAKTGAQIIVHEADAEFIGLGSSPLGSVASTLFGTSSKLLGDLLTPVVGLFAPKTRPDIIVRDGDSLQDLGFHAKVVYLPGHTNGHTALVFNYEGESHALVADLFSNRNNQLTVQKSYATDWNQVYASARVLKEIWNPDYSYPGHGDRFTSEVLQALNIEENRIQ